MNTHFSNFFASLINILRICAIGLVLLIDFRQAAAQGTAFTYSGRLSDGGSPANGTYDVTFLLAGSSNGVPQVGAAITNSGILISNGLFTVTLDFGSQIFTGNPFWLEVGMRTNGATNFTMLNPPQLIAATPYAIMAGSASNLLGTIPTAQLTGVLSMAQLSGAVVTNDAANVSLTGAFSGIGSGLTNLNPANLSAGTAGISISGNAATATTAASVTGDISDSQLSTNIARLGGTNTFTGTNVFSGVIFATNGNNIINGTFTGDGGGLSGLNATKLAGTISPAQLPTSVITNTESGATLSGAFSGDGSGLTNYQATNLVYSVSTNPPLVSNGTNFSLDFAYSKLIWTLTTNACISNTLNATSGDNHLEVWIQATNKVSPFVISWLPTVNLCGTFTTNGLRLTNSAGYWVMAVSQYGTNWNTNTCTYAIVPPNR